MTATGKVYILILNWNAWQHTIECLESVLALDYPDFQIIVCDNGSEDDSVAWLRRWASGEEIPAARPSPRLAHLFPARPRGPVPLAEYDRPTAEAGGDAAAAGAKLILISIGRNLGFAGANNVGLRFALARGDFEFVWLLNDDTVVMPDALTALVRRMRSDRVYGQCGSQLRYYYAPGVVQANGGGAYAPWAGMPRHLGEGSLADQPVDAAAVERRLSYLVGASMLVRREFIEQVGLLSEEYFFYFEELDWVRRARGRFKLGFAPDSIVYHKGSTSTTADLPRGRSSRLGEFYYTRSRARFTRIHHPWYLPVMWLLLGASAVYRLATGRRPQARTLWAALRDPSTYSSRPMVASEAPDEFAR